MGNYILSFGLKAIIVKIADIISERKKDMADALDELREHCKKIKHGSIKPLIILKDGVAVEVIIKRGDETEKLRPEKKT